MKDSRQGGGFDKGQNEIYISIIGSVGNAVLGVPLDLMSFHGQPQGYKLGFIVLLVFPRRGRVSRPAGGETPPLHGLTEFVICTVKSRFAMHTTSYKATVMSETRSPLIYDYNVLSRKKLTQQRFPSGLGSAATPMPIITKSGSIRFS